MSTAIPPIPFIGPLTFSSHVPWCPWLWGSPSVFLCGSGPWHFWRVLASYFVECFSVWLFPYVSPWFDFELCIFGRNLPETVLCPWVHRIRRHVVAPCSSLVMFSLIPGEVEPARVLHYKVTVCPFVTNMCLVGEHLKLCKYPLLILFPSLL